MNKSLQKIIYEFKTKILSPKFYKEFSERNHDQHRNDISTLNFEKRKKIIEFAYKNTLFYKKKYDRYGIYPSDIKTEEDFNKLPIVTRDDIKNNFSEFIATNLDRKNYYRATTGGSTGVPISVLHDKRYSLNGIQRRVLNWWGVHPFENSAYIYRLRRTGIRKLLNSILWWPTKRIFLNAAEMNNRTMLYFIDKFNKTKPALLQGYVGGVYEFALFLKDNNLTIVPPKAVWVTSAPLSEAQRTLMQTIFQAPVYDQYGTCEIMWLGAECKEQAGLHMMSDIRHIEFVDGDNKPVPTDSWGRILLTDLENYAFPLIRYEIGDLGRALSIKCKCGITLPLMDNVKGRKSDVIRTPSGIILSGEFLTTIFDDFPDAVRGFQVYQAKDFSVVISFVPNEQKNLDKIIEKIVDKIKMKSKNQINITAKKVDKISHLKGKTQFVVSEIK